MRGHQRRRARRADQIEKGRQHQLRRGFIQIAGRFIGQHQRRAVGQRARHRHPQLLPARQLRRLVGEPRAEAKRCEQFIGARGGAGFGHASHHLGQHHILARGEIGQQVVELVNEAHPLPADAGAAKIIKGTNGFAANPDTTGEPAFQQANGLQQR